MARYLEFEKIRSLHLLFVRSFDVGPKGSALSANGDRALCSCYFLQRLGRRIAVKSRKVVHSEISEQDTAEADDGKEGESFSSPAPDHA